MNFTHKMLGVVPLLLLPITRGAIHINIPEINREITKNKTHFHLNGSRVRRYCEERNDVCASGDSVVCAVRQAAGEFVYKQFNNSCFLFIANMCEYPGEEFHIVSDTTCEEYTAARRHGFLKPGDGIKTGAGGNNTSNGTTKGRPSLRAAATTMSTIYDIDTAFDYHHCPLSCPDTYQPVCVCANRNWGLYYKFYSFSNHCEGDRYYCKHWTEFSPPPGENEKVQSSFLGWSYCGSSRYLMFSRFSEASASLGHYGWLHGDQRFSHIMEPNEKAPGYG